MNKGEHTVSIQMLGVAQVHMRLGTFHIYVLSGIYMTLIKYICVQVRCL